MGTTPASELGLEPGSYEAYCINQAVWYFGTHVEAEMEKVSHKPSKEERGAIQKRKRVLGKYIQFAGETEEKQFADPAMFFQ